MRPALTKPISATVVAEDDCTTAVASVPESTALAGVPVKRARACLSAWPPKATSPWDSSIMPTRNSPRPPKKGNSTFCIRRGLVGWRVLPAAGVVFDRQGCVVAEALGFVHLCAQRCGSQPGRGQVVVQPPANVVGIGLAPVAPPGVALAGGVGVQLAGHVHQVVPGVAGGE